MKKDRLLKNRGGGKRGKDKNHSGDGDASGGRPKSQSGNVALFCGGRFGSREMIDMDKE